MNQYTRFSSRASLALLGQHMQTLGIWQVIERHVYIRQKVRKHKPVEKLLDAFINIVAGGHGLVEVNTRVRPDGALQRAFGRQGCADQSTVSRTLDACRADTVGQMRKAM